MPGHIKYSSANPEARRPFRGAPGVPAPPPHAHCSKFLFQIELNSLTLKNCKRNFDKPSMKRWQCPIYNGTLESFGWSNMIHISMFLFIKTVYFHLRFLCESDLRISCLQEAMEKLALYESEKRQYLPHSLSDQCFKGTVVNRALLS